MDYRALRILVVDDDQASRRLLRALVERAGHEAIEAGDGRDGLARMRQLRPEMVITAWRMPGMGGGELTRAIRADPDGRRPYVVLATSLEDENDLLAAFELGVDDFVGKPLRPTIVAARLRTGERIVRLQRENESRIDELQGYSEELTRAKLRFRELAITDELTGLPNRRYALERLQLEWSAAERRHSPLSCMVVDLDGLKQINDAYGSERGDVVLKTVAALMRKSIRSQDIVCRIGGDEFLVICPGASLDSVMTCGERLVSAVGDFGIHAEGCPFGLSIGAAERRPDIVDPQALTHVADQSMYHAKRFGKNQVYSRQEDDLRFVQGLSDICQLCRARGAARRHSCLWLHSAFPEDFVAAGQCQMPREHLAPVPPRHHRLFATG